MYINIRVGKENGPLALKTKVNWDIFLGGQEPSKYSSLEAFSKESDPENIVSNVCHIVPYVHIAK